MFPDALKVFPELSNSNEQSMLEAFLQDPKRQKLCEFIEQQNEKPVRLSRSPQEIRAKRMARHASISVTFSSRDLFEKTKSKSPNSSNVPNTPDKNKAFSSINVAKNPVQGRKKSLKEKSDSNDGQTKRTTIDLNDAMQILHGKNFHDTIRELELKYVVEEKMLELLAGVRNALNNLIYQYAEKPNASSDQAMVWFSVFGRAVYELKQRLTEVISGRHCPELRGLFERMYNVAKEVTRKNSFRSTNEAKALAKTLGEVSMLPMGSIKKLANTKLHSFLPILQQKLNGLRMLQAKLRSIASYKLLDLIAHEDLVSFLFGWIMYYHS